MLESSGHVGLGNQSLEARAGGGGGAPLPARSARVVRDLHGDGSPELAILDAQDTAHAPTTHLAEDAVAIARIDAQAVVLGDLARSRSKRRKRSEHAFDRAVAQDL